MAALLILLLILFLVFGGIGFAAHVFWWVAIVALVLLVVGYVSRN